MLSREAKIGEGIGHRSRPLVRRRTSQFSACPINQPTGDLRA